MTERPIRSITRVRGSVAAPPSKSATQRAIVAAALAPGRSRLRHPLLSDDPRRLLAALTAVGIEAHVRDAASDPAIEIDGRGGDIPAADARVAVGNAGTAMRFLTALLALGRGTYVIDGDDRMRRRPIGDLIDALRSLGARVEAVDVDGFPPVRVGGGVPGGPARLRGSASSQYLSALLLAAPCMPRGVDITLDGDLVSRPYVELTVAMMRRFGVAVEVSADGARYRVASGQGYAPRDLTLEGDYSSASYFFAAAAITAGRVRVTGLDPCSVQGDAGFVDLLRRMGCAVTRGEDFIEVEGAARLAGIDADCRDMPDIVPTLAVTALFASGPTRIAGVPHLRLKESDRLAALAAEITRLGGSATESRDGLTVVPAPLHGARIETWDDHRMAMAFAVAGLRVPGVVIADPGCVSKSFPDFWESFESLSQQP